MQPPSPNLPPTRLRRERPSKRRSRNMVLAGGGIVVVIAVVLIMIGMRSESAEQQWAEGESYGDWTVRYTGYGQVTSNGERITLEPQAVKDDDTTHGGLVHTIGQCRDTEFSVTMHTEAQLRQPDPNVWEVGWVLWNFESDTQFYAVALKPNGWEISKQDPDYKGNQRFLASGDTPKFPIGKDYRVTISHNDNEMTVVVDGQELATVTDTETPYQHGSIGLYTEDARVHFTDFDLPACAS